MQFRMISPGRMPAGNAPETLRLRNRIWSKTAASPSTTDMKGTQSSSRTEQLDLFADELENALGDSEALDESSHDTHPIGT